MAVCTSCGNEVDESASFCTSCGKPMPAAAHPSAAVTVTRPVCSSCGAQADPDSLFCTECGKRLDPEPMEDAEAVPDATAAHDIALAAPLKSEIVVATVPANPFCTSCGAKLEPGMGFCTNCGQPAAAALANVAAPKTDVEPPAPAVEATQPVHLDPVIPAPTSTESTKDAAAAEQVIKVPASSQAESTSPPPSAAPMAKDRPIVVVPTNQAQVDSTQVKPTPVEPTQIGPVPQVSQPPYAAPSDYPPAQPGGGAFRMIVLVLLLLIVLGGFGGWYFMGVETVIVCSPPDVKVFLDDKELAPTSYGRYVISHLSRQPHLLKVQRAGFADTIQRLDFPMTSLHEWVNIKLVPRQSSRPPRR